MLFMPTVTHQQTLAGEIYTQLKQRIVGYGYADDSSLDPGTPLRTDRLAREFGVSHTPIRESLRLLERDGLVEHLPRRGVVVKEVTREEFEEMFVARRALEAITARGAAEHATVDQKLQMRALLTESTDNVHRLDRAGHIQIDQDLHRLIAKSCGNSVVDEMTRSLINRFQVFFIRTQHDGAVGMKRGHDEHWAVFNAINAGDGDTAERLMLEHIESSRQHAIDEGWI